MRRDRISGGGALITALLKQAAIKFGPPKDWDQAAVALWIRSEVSKTQAPAFDPRAAQTGDSE